MDLLELLQSFSGEYNTEEIIVVYIYVCNGANSTRLVNFCYYLSDVEIGDATPAFLVVILFLSMFKYALQSTLIAKEIVYKIGKET